MTNKKYNKWYRMVSLCFDIMHIANGVKFDPHSMEVVGFAEDAFQRNVLLEE